MKCSLLLSRRRVLKGMLGTGAVTLGLPFLDCFLNDNGTALAATGRPLPICFGTWYYGCGLNPGRWEPRTTGSDYHFGVELRGLEAFRHKLNVYSQMSVFLDGRTPAAHAAGPAVILQGMAPPTAARPMTAGASIDAVIADVIGTRTRFRSLEISGVGNPNSSRSKRVGESVNPAEISPLALYSRIFGPEFRDPNAAEFEPDPVLMVRRSVLSGVADQRKSMMQELGSADQRRLDEYFTSLRELEQQLEIAAQKPAPVAACSVPRRPENGPIGAEVGTVSANHRLFAKILAHALACDQTRVFNLMLTDSLSQLRLPGEANTHHMFTHEDPIDAQLGYQPNVAKFFPLIVGMFGTLLAEFDAFREGDKTLLDRMLVLNYTDSGYAKNHTTDNIPMLTAGSAGGRMKTGIHVAAAKGDPVTRLSLTVQQVMGVPISSFGAESNKTKRSITEVIA